MPSLLRALALGLIAALTLSTSVFGAAQRPMSGRFTVAVVPVEQRCGPNALTIGFAGTGIATHLGRMEGTGTNCTELTLTQGAVAIWDGSATFVAADGSSITVSYDGLQQEPVSGVASATTHNTVVSGTGRFDGASGSWTTIGELDFSTGVFTGDFSGWLSY